MYKKINSIHGKNVWQNHSYSTKHTLRTIFYSSHQLKEHKIFLSVKYLSCLFTIHGKRMHELSLLSTMYYMIFCYDSIITWPTNPITIPLLKDPLLFLLIIWTKVMAIYIIVYFQRHFSLTPRLGYLYSPTEKFIHWITLVADIRINTSNNSLILVMLVNNCLIFFIFPFLFSMYSPSSDTLLLGTFLFITRKNCFTSI
jgi:hypothetical protein